MDWKRFFSDSKLNRPQKNVVIRHTLDASFPDLDYYVLVILACALASLGLAMNSTATIIGAMLVSPLMAPILGVSMGSVTGNSQLFKRSLITIAAGIMLSLALSFSLTHFLIRLPFGFFESVPREILVRVAPTPLDLLIALVGGIIGAYAWSNEHISSALPGVAISISLMPPLCTAGISLALGNHAHAVGATLLFLSNLVAIIFAGLVTFVLMGFNFRHSQNGNGNLSSRILLFALLVILIAIPLTILSLDTIAINEFQTNAARILIKEVSLYTQAELLELQVITEGSLNRIEAIIRIEQNLTDNEFEVIQAKLQEQLQKPIVLELTTVPMQVFHGELITTGS